SGTLGTKASVQVVVPFLTESYSSVTDPSESTVSISTLKHFPFFTEHTIQWASQLFENTFFYPTRSAQDYQKDPKAFLERIEKYSIYQKKEEIENVLHILGRDRTKCFEDGIKCARQLFQEHFHDTIVRLLFYYPHVLLTHNGEYFWSGDRLCPHETEFDSNNELHMDFVYAASNLYAEMVLSIHENDEQVKASVNNIEDETVELQQMVQRLPKLEDILNIELKPLEFEIDAGTNFHIDFITSASNLRAENYEIDPTDSSQAKQIVGRILSAIVITTAMVTGLVYLEVYKFVQKHKRLNHIVIA
ncbi:unnamed protein product, partial [Didymodactylos carnosus]